jgi:hypothetical protein
MNHIARRVTLTSDQQTILYKKERGRLLHQGRGLISLPSRVCSATSAILLVQVEEDNQVQCKRKGFAPSTY